MNASIYGLQSPNCDCVSKIVRILGALFFVSFFAGCAPTSPTSNENKALFERLCRAPDRDFIKRKVKSSGYAEARTSDSALACPRASLIPEVFIEMGYQYYECVVGPWTKENSPDSKSYRFTLEKQGSQSCKGKDERSIKANRMLDYWRDKQTNFKDKCISVTEQARPTSRYIQLNDSGRVKLDGTHIAGHQKDWRSIPGYITFSRARVIDRHTNEIIAERKFYFLYPLGAEYVDVASEQCERKSEWRISNVVTPISP